MNHVKNAFLQFQSRADKGHVDFYCNGVIGGAIEVLLDATESSVSQNIDEHANRFVEDKEKCKYKYKHWALLHFAMTKPVILPTDTAIHDRVYTYSHENNALYQGKKVIKQPAVLSLPCPGRVPYIPLSKRSFTTSTAAATNSSLFSRHFSTVVRRFL